MYEEIVNEMLTKSSTASIENDILYRLNNMTQADYIKLFKENRKRVVKYANNMLKTLGADTLVYMLDMLLEEAIRNEVMYIWKKEKEITKKI